jgi:hypothetical protein
VTAPWIFVLGDAMQGLGIALAALALYNFFRTVVLDLRATLTGQEGTSYARIAAGTLGVAFALFIGGGVLEVLAR